MTAVVKAMNGTLIVGGGFGGAHVARLLGRAGATIVNPAASMLYTPLLPEVAAGAIEPRRAVVPLRRMCPHAEVLRGRVVAVDEAAHRATVHTDVGPVEVEYQRLVVALGSTARMLPVPGLAEKAITFKTLGDAMRLRSHALRMLECADADPDNAERYLTFVFVGAGYAGVEALAELRQLVRETLRTHPRLVGTKPRWVLVDAGPKILGEVPGRLAEDAAHRLVRDGVDIRTGTVLESVQGDTIRLSDGTDLLSETLVWTAGVVPPPIVGELGLPLDARGRIVVDDTLRVAGRSDVWAIGDCAAVPNAATPGVLDPPTCQHALRQARRLARTLRGKPEPYRYRSLGQGATLGRLKGVALVGGISLRGLPAAAVVRWYHISQVPQLSRALRIVLDSAISLVFGRDAAEVPDLGDSVRPWSADQRLPRVSTRCATSGRPDSTAARRS